MKIISTNIAEARIIEWKGKEVSTGLYKFGVKQGIFLGKEDVEHDNVMDRRYHAALIKPVTSIRQIITNIGKTFTLNWKCHMECLAKT